MTNGAAAVDSAAAAAAAAGPPSASSHHRRRKIHPPKIPPDSLSPAALPSFRRRPPPSSVGVSAVKGGPLVLLLALVVASLFLVGSYVLLLSSPLPSPGDGPVLRGGDDGGALFRRGSTRGRRPWSSPPELALHLESPPAPWKAKDGALLIRNVTAKELTRIGYPGATASCDNLPSRLPVNSYPTGDGGEEGLDKDDAGIERDPYLPWIHDLFPSDDGSVVHIVAQNRRRCHTGKGNEHVMAHWEPQVALFQPVAVKRVSDEGVRSNGPASDADGHAWEAPRYRLSGYGDADLDGRETRFVCRFKRWSHDGSSPLKTNEDDPPLRVVGETLSQYPFNYEYVTWRKGRDAMLDVAGKETAQFWLSQLLFDCPVPSHLRDVVASGKSVVRGGENGATRIATLYLDVIPIRTPVRRAGEQFFHEGHGGPMAFDADAKWGDSHVLPNVEDSGRWENLPVCLSSKLEFPHAGGRDNVGRVAAAADADASAAALRAKPHRLVACAWTSSTHQRRGNERLISDGDQRLREWIAFHLLAGFDHVYVYDNSGANDPGSRGSGLRGVTDLFSPDEVTRIEWPHAICNNNRPAHADPGERSSQYAAESDCRVRFGPFTEWMATIDPDEYLIPMGEHLGWGGVLDKLDREGRKVLKFRSTRARPRKSLMTPTYDEESKECKHGLDSDPCLGRDENQTFLRTYNCEYIKSPKPARFERAMKQIYRPDFVLSHFVHYSTVTKDLATLKQDTDGPFIKSMTTNSKTERFVDELNEGVLVHAKTTVPVETFYRGSSCQLEGKGVCMVGIPCPDDLPFDDEKHKDNVFRNEKGEFCNCWINRKVEDYWVPKLEEALHKLKQG